MFPKIYVISLERQKSRRIFIEAKLRKYQLDYEFFNAIDFKDFTKNEVLGFVDQDRRHWTNYLRPGAVCCALSHIGTYEKFLRTEHEHCIVLEDDTFPCSNIMEIADFFDADDGHRLPDILLLFSYSEEKMKVFSNGMRHGRYGVYLCRDSFPMGGGAYLINRKAAKQILAYNSPVKATADQWSEFSRLDLTVGVLKPDIFKDALFDSTLGYLSPRMIWLQRLVPKPFRRIKKKVSYWRRSGNIVTRSR